MSRKLTVTRRPSYGDAVMWLARNDETLLHDTDEIDGLTTVLLAADLFGVQPRTLAVDIVRARHGAGRWQIPVSEQCGLCKRQEDETANHPTKEER